MYETRLGRISEVCSFVGIATTEFYNFFDHKIVHFDFKSEFGNLISFYVIHSLSGSAPSLNQNRTYVKNILAIPHRPYQATMLELLSTAGLPDPCLFKVQLVLFIAEQLIGVFVFFLIIIQLLSLHFNHLQHQDADALCG